MELWGKILGAGGGGFLFYVDEKEIKFKKSLKKFTVIPFKFENKGSKIILIMNNNFKLFFWFN